MRDPTSVIWAQISSLRHLQTAVICLYVHSVSDSPNKPLTPNSPSLGPLEPSSQTFRKLLKEVVYWKKSHHIHSALNTWAPSDLSGNLAP